MSWFANNEMRCSLLRCVARLARRLRGSRLAHDNGGAAAVEFALVAAPFLAILFATLQTAIIFYADQALETAVADSSRLIMTGQAQKASFDAVAFKNAVCARVYAVFDCQNGIYVDVRTASNFGSAGTGLPLDPTTGQFTNNFTYQPGGPGEIVVVRAVYQWPVYVSLLGLNLSNMAGRKRLLMATAAFRNEPF
jgi:Flp pilus assembly protein TadG